MNESAYARMVIDGEGADLLGLEENQHVELICSSLGFDFRVFRVQICDHHYLKKTFTGSAKECAAYLNGVRDAFILASYLG